jgi:purine-nucleoside phosphorylase
MAILDFPAERWLQALGWAAADVPDALVLEGTWWHAAASKARLARLEGVRETAFPDIHVGRCGAARVAYACAYGAARAAEVAHVCAQAGVPLLIQIGTCGALQRGAAPGTVAVPRNALAQEGVARSYGGGDTVPLDAAWGDRAALALAQRGIPVTRGPHLSWTTLFAQSDRLCADWAAEGIATVDMETAAVGAVAQRFGAAALALLATWDILGDGRTFLDPVSPDESAALARANAATFEVALALAGQVAAARQDGTTTMISGRRQ